MHCRGDTGSKITCNGFLHISLPGPLGTCKMVGQKSAIKDHRLGIKMNILISRKMRDTMIIKGSSYNFKILYDI